MTRLYAEFYRFPFLVFRIDPAVYVIAAGVTLAAAAVGALRAVRDVVALPPAVAMAPPAPAIYRRLLPEAFYAVLKIPQSLIMVARHLMRWPLRTVSSVLGIALAVSVLVGSLWVVRLHRIHDRRHLSSRRPAGRDHQLRARAAAVGAVRCRRHCPA